MYLVCMQLNVTQELKGTYYSNMWKRANLKIICWVKEARKKEVHNTPYLYSHIILGKATVKKAHQLVSGVTSEESDCIVV